jgi:transcriptional regulator EpsA
MNSTPVSGTSDAPDRPPPALESLHLSPRQAQAFVRLVETAFDVKRRFQFFVWLQSQVQVLLPHALAVCGAYSRQRKQLQYEVFNSIALPAPVLDALGTPESPLLQRAARLWVQGHARPLVAPLDGADSPWRELALADELARAGLRQVLVHGVARPERPHEIETLFLLADAAVQPVADAAHALELALPHLHATFLRTQGVERELGSLPVREAAPLADRPAPVVTAREAQILRWVREGKSNLEIGELLGISALTVKNHIQKVLRKLGASNRAHAVTLAVRLRVLPGVPAGEEGGLEG